MLAFVILCFLVWSFVANNITDSISNRDTLTIILLLGGTAIVSLISALLAISDDDW